MVHLLHQHVGRRGGEGALVVVLPINVEPGRAVVLAQVVLRLGQHAAGAAGRVEQLAHGAGRGEQLVVVDEQDAHHQPDDFARREVVARGLVGQFVEAPDEVLEDEPHLLVRHRVRVQVHVAELGDDEVEQVRLAHPLDLGLELEEVEDVAHVLREALDVTDEMLVDVIGVALELFEVERRVVVEALAGGFAEVRVKRIAFELATLAPMEFCQHLRLGRRKHAVEAAQHRHGQHDALILRRAVGSAQQVGDLPDQVRKVVVVRHEQPQCKSLRILGKAVPRYHRARIMVSSRETMAAIAVRSNPSLPRLLDSSMTACVHPALSAVSPRQCSLKRLPDMMNFPHQNQMEYRGKGHRDQRLQTQDDG